jgi:hypothetical protein
VCREMARGTPTVQLAFVSSGHKLLVVPPRGQPLCTYQPFNQLARQRLGERDQAPHRVALFMFVGFKETKKRIFQVGRQHVKSSSEEGRPARPYPME